jgi:hypothetical protein
MQQENKLETSANHSPRIIKTTTRTVVYRQPNIQSCELSHLDVAGDMPLLDIAFTYIQDLNYFH